MTVRALLPDEADDMTATELHGVVLFRLVGALQVVFGDLALVLWEIFVRTGSDEVGLGEQYSADVMVLPRGEGLAQLRRKRDFFGRIGVPHHIEIDPEHGTLTEWRNIGGAGSPRRSERVLSQ